MSHKIAPRAEAGFTLIELMVAVVIFVILAALAVPSLSSYLEKSRLRGAADGVVSAIGQARQVAVKYDRNVSLATVVTSSTNWCLGAQEAATPAAGDQATAAVACDCTVATQCIVDENKQLIVASSAYPGVSIASAAGTLSFDGRLGIRDDGSVGNADASSFDLTAPSGKFSLTVKVSPLGQATVCTKTGNILGYPSC